MNSRPSRAVHYTARHCLKKKKRIIKEKEGRKRGRKEGRKEHRYVKFKWNTKDQTPGFLSNV